MCLIKHLNSQKVVKRISEIKQCSLSCLEQLGPGVYKTNERNIMLSTRIYFLRFFLGDFFFSSQKASLHFVNHNASSVAHRLLENMMHVMLR